jgi:aryl-alcohol dehydrogenase-like predicted oxidoreductase
VTLAAVIRSVPVSAAKFEPSLVHREPEADLFSASRALGMGIVTWSPLGGGMLTGKYRSGQTGRAQGFGGRVFQPENSAQCTDIMDAVLAVASELGASAGQVAIAWAGTHGAVPIIGPRTPEQLADNLGALPLKLSAEQISDSSLLTKQLQMDPSTLTRNIRPLIPMRNSPAMKGSTSCRSTSASPRQVCYPPSSAPRWPRRSPPSIVPSPERRAAS